VDGMGYGGGGGGAGEEYPDSGTCCGCIQGIWPYGGRQGGVKDGEPGNGVNRCWHYGGDGGGYGGQQGGCSSYPSDTVANGCSIGGNGAGPAAGIGGAYAPGGAVSGGNGSPGGYLVGGDITANATIDIYIGSGGGGGGGGQTDHGNCCCFGYGGDGGVPVNYNSLYGGCTGGMSGSGGAAGGGAIVLMANSITIDGYLDANGAGLGDAPRGYGGGGGILVAANTVHIGSNAHISSLGGRADPVTGGTFKVRATQGYLDSSAVVTVGTPSIIINTVTPITTGAASITTAVGTSSTSSTSAASTSSTSAKSSTSSTSAKSSTSSTSAASTSSTSAAGTSGNNCQEGSLLCKCLVNGSCSNGLTCASGICVQINCGTSSAGTSGQGTGHLSETTNVSMHFTWIATASVVGILLIVIRTNGR